MRLIGWAGLAKTNDTTDLEDLLEDNPYQAPDMCSLLHTNYTETTDPMFNIDFMKLACDFLGVQSIGLETSTKNNNCYRVKVLREDEMHIMHRAMEIKAYVMSLTK